MWTIVFIFVLHCMVILLLKAESRVKERAQSARFPRRLLLLGYAGSGGGSRWSEA